MSFLSKISTEKEEMIKRQGIDDKNGLLKASNGGQGEKNCPLLHRVYTGVDDNRQTFSEMDETTAATHPCQCSFY